MTRLARGLAVGSDIEYADEVTLLRAIEIEQNFRKSVGKSSAFCLQ